MPSQTVQDEQSSKSSNEQSVSEPRMNGISKFQAMVARQSDDGIQLAAEMLDASDLPEGEVTIRVTIPVSTTRTRWR
jgi:hypothetical protein